jgi:hypothetical protein
MSTTNAAFISDGALFCIVSNPASGRIGKAVGSHSGLVGTWEFLSSSVNGDIAQYLKSDWTISASTIAVSAYKSDSNNFSATPTSSQTGSYTTGTGGTITMTSSSGSSVTENYLVIGNYLVLGAGSSTDDLAFHKQAINLGSQAGTLLGGIAGTATIAVTTANIAEGTAGTFTWYTSPTGATMTTAPTGLGAAVSAVSNNTASVSVTTTTDAMPGSYYFALSEGFASSSVATIDVAASPSITFNANGGSGAMAAQPLATGTTANLRANAFTHAGYSFVGWDTTSAGNGKEYADGASYTMGTVGIILYAQWTANLNVITFNSNDEAGKTSTQTLATAATANLTANTFTRAGRIFSSWNTLADGTGARYGDKASYTMGASNITLYAQWAVAYSITYDANGATGSPPVDLKAYLENATIIVKGNTGGLTYSGFAFAGWTTNTSTAEAGSSYSPGAEFAMGSNDITLFAVWIPTSLTFTSSGKSISITGPNTYTGALAIPPGVTAIDSEAFFNDTGLTSVAIPSSVTSIGSYAFRLTYLRKAAIPFSVTSIGTHAFYFCPYLASIDVDAANPNYKSISGVLYDKAGKTLIQAPGSLSGAFIIPSGVTSIGDSAFESTEITGITIPAGVTSIGADAFWGAWLTSVLIPSSVTSIGEDAFWYGNYLTNINVDEANLSYRSISGTLFDKAGETLIQAPAGLVGSFIIPSTTISIGHGSFAHAQSLTSITIPSSVISIADSAFLGLTSLTSITIPSSITSIGRCIFSGCTSLTSLTMQSEIPPSLPENSGTFANLKPSGILIHVPSAAAVTAYQAATGWNEYSSQIVFP